MAGFRRAPLSCLATCAVLAVAAPAQKGLKDTAGVPTEYRTPSGKVVKSSDAVQKFTFDWTLRNLSSPPTDKPNVVGDPLRALLDQSWLPADARTPRPTIVWFASQEPDPKAAERMFGSDEVGAAARYFDCIKIFVEDVESKADRLRYAKTVPTLYFFDAGAHESSRVAGGVSGPGEVYRHMTKAAGVHFKRPLPDLVAKYVDYVRRLDEVAGRREVVSREIKDADAADLLKPSEKLKEVLKKLRAEEAALEKRKEKLDEEERALLAVEFKADPYAPPPAKPAPGSAPAKG